LEFCSPCFSVSAFVVAMLGGRRRYYRKTITTEDPEHPEHPEHTSPRTPGASRLHTVRRATSHTPSLGYAPGEGRRTETTQKTYTRTSRPRV
jgi:hypothetical protein